MPLSSRLPRIGLLAALSALALLLLAPPTPALAVPFDGNPKILLHVRGTTTKNICGVGGLADCGAAVTEGGLSLSPTGPFYFVYLLGARGSMASVAAIQVGIQYQNGCPADRFDQTGLDIFSWSVCATLEFAGQGWPEPGTGNLITFDAVNRCQTGETAVAGYFYVACYGTPDILQLVPRPVDNLAKLVNCDAVETNIPVASLGRASFSAGAATPGCNPCDGPCVPQGPTSCAGPTDVTPPNPVTDLAVTGSTSSSLTIGWTAPADNPGGSGVDGYEIRRSLAPITPANFALAQFVSPPSPAPPGTPQSLVIAGLAPQTTYYVAMRVRDNAQNVSALSNVVNGTTDSGPPLPNANTKLLLHVAPATPLPGGACAGGQLADCDDVDTSGELLPTRHYVYLLAAQFSNLSGLQCGITYDDGLAAGVNDHDRLDIFSWTLCAFLEFQQPSPSWPSPGSGNLIVWNATSNCQAGAVAVAGYFYVGAYDADVLFVIPRPIDQQAKVADCTSVEHNLGTDDLGSAAFSASGQQSGVNPCEDGPVPVQPTTWSRVKVLTGAPTAPR